LKLDIWDVDIDIVNDFLFGCPILETLDICLFSFDYHILRVPSTLKRLKISSNVGSDSNMEIDLHLLGFNDLNSAQTTLAKRGESVS
jgi:hypothetical protein